MKQEKPNIPAVVAMLRRRDDIKLSRLVVAEIERNHGQQLAQQVRKAIGGRR